MENEIFARVYVLVDNDGFIINVESSRNLEDTTGWIEIDSGYGRRYAYAQLYYFDKPIWTDDNFLQYRMDENGMVRECAPEEIREQEEARKPLPVEPESSMWDELDTAYQSGINSI